MHPLFEGMILGFTLAIMLGPAMFTLIQTSIHRGMYSGVLLAGGIFLSDLTLVFLCFVGAAQILGNDKNYLLFGIIGGIILMVFGIVTYMRKIHITGESSLSVVKLPGPLTYIFKGFFLNIANPFVWIFWVSVMVTVTSSHGGDQKATMAFFAGTLFTILITDIIKVIVASRLKRYLQPKLLIKVNHAVGIMLVVFGISLLVRTIFHF